VISLRYFGAFLILLALVSPAQARRQRAPVPAPIRCFLFCPPIPMPVARNQRIKSADAPVLRRTRSSKVVASASREPSRRADETVVEHPSGCPWHAFCACGLAVKFFGHPVESLASARAWYRFKRSDPAPGMVAVRPHHVFALEYQIQGDVWMAYDANSGSHLTRMHPKSISGYTIVNPHG
jgi:hypothetical protein